MSEVGLRMRLGFGTRLEAAALRAGIRLFGALDPVRASDLGGFIARCIGPLLPVSRVADMNLRRAMPELDRRTRRRIVRGVWDNLGRTAGELPHLPAICRLSATGPGCLGEGLEVIEALARRGGPAILVSAHLGNWEVLPALGATLGVPCSGVYRAAANPLVDSEIIRLRQRAAGAHVPMFAKGSHGARQALAHLRQGGFLALLVDQKLNDGVAAQFFGRRAMTAPGPAMLALRTGSPVVLAHVERLGAARFRVVVEPPVALPASGDGAADILVLTQRINDRLEAWIRARPEQWLWLHRRWPRED